jgi:hypothetical protein
MIKLDDLMLCCSKQPLDDFFAQENTYGHAEDRLLGLVNFTGTHFECSAKKKMQKKREEMESVKKEETPGIREGRKRKSQAGRGARKKKLPREEKRPPARTNQSESSGG